MITYRAISEIRIICVISIENYSAIISFITLTTSSVFGLLK